MGFDDRSTIHERDNSAAVGPGKFLRDLDLKAGGILFHRVWRPHVARGRWSHTFDTFV
jgi:hypothetical protein